MSATLPLTPVVEAKLVSQDSAQRNDLAAALHALAFNPDVPVDKLEKIIELHERVQANAAKAEFDAAFAVMQAELPIIIESKKGDGGKWSYAPLEDIVEQVRPILARHGFSLSHTTEWPDKNVVRVIGVLSHSRGHERRSEFVSAADTSGSKNAVQALGSVNHYGRRYTTSDLLNIVTRNQDDDARRAVSPEPEGFTEWLDAAREKSKEGLAALQAFWQTANRDPELRQFAAYLTKTQPNAWNDLKKQAARVGGAK
jgi:hypothetical protein